MAESDKNQRFTKIYLMLWGLCILTALVIFTLYTLGFRLGTRLEPVKVGAIDLSANETGLQIFLDNRERKALFQNGFYLMKNVTPGAHSLLVSKDGFWPWAKTLTVVQNSTRRLYAFIFPMDGISVKTLSPEMPEYDLARRRFKTMQPPSLKSAYSELLPDASVKEWIALNAPDRIVSSDTSTALYVLDHTIYVAWISDTDAPPHYFCEENPCKLVMPVTVSTAPVKSIDFYKGRPDVIIFAAGNTIYGIEVDREGTQNFQPLFTGTDPYFYQDPKGALYIKDGNSILRASL